MRSHFQSTLCTAMLLLATGCAYGSSRSADLPQPRSLPRIHPDDDVVVPVQHPPDAMITARNPDPRWPRLFESAVWQVIPGRATSWSIPGFLTAF